MKRIVAPVFRLAAAGAAVGLGAAAWAIADQNYLAQGLWRTSLWVTSRGLLVGYLVGAAVATAMLLLASLASALPRAKTNSAGAFAFRLRAVLRRSSRVLDTRATRAVGRALAGRAGWVLAGLLSFLTVALWAAGWSVAASARTGAQQRQRNVAIIGLDTLRADHASLLSAGDQSRDVTPNLRELVGARSSVFTDAISQAPWTLPAFSSMFTGLYPEQHGAEQRWQKLPASQLTLAEILREAGFRTLGVSSGLYVTNASGLRQGFEVFDESQAQGQLNVTSEQVTDKAIKLLARHGKEPFFLFVHYFDPHWVFHDHPDYDFGEELPAWMKEMSQTLKQDEFTQQVARLRGFSGRGSLTREELGSLRGLYDEEIAHTDAEVARLLRYMSETGLDSNTLIILVADHGEEFMERGNLGHGSTLCHEVIHVPLAIALPGASKREVRSRPVETRCVFTTVLDSLKVRMPQGDGFPVSLLADDAPNTLVRSANHRMASGIDGRMFPEPVDVWWTSIRDGRWKLIKEHLRGRVMLFDLLNDPAERRNCAKDNPEVRQRLERELDRRDAAAKRSSPKGPVPEADEAQKRRLKSLGYL